MRWDLLYALQFDPDVSDTWSVSKTCQFPQTIQVIKCRKSFTVPACLWQAALLGVNLLSCVE